MRSSLSASRLFKPSTLVSLLRSCQSEKRKSRRKVSEKVIDIAIAISVVVITDKYDADCILFSRGVVLRNACQRYGVLESGRQRWWPPQPICLARLFAEHWLEDVHYIRGVVCLPNSYHLALVPRDQE